MAWYRNHYHCGDCGTDWEDEWSCCCDDECPACGSGDWSPEESEDLTEVVWETAAGFALMRSPVWADDRPSYERTAVFDSRLQANRYLHAGELI